MQFIIEEGISLPEAIPSIKKTYKAKTQTEAGFISKPTFIYALKNADTNEIRYVGKTIDVTNRYKSHCRSKTNSKTSCWIRSLQNKPEIIILEEVTPFGNWQEAEQFWIAYFKSLGARLTNLTEGGEGCVGIVFSEESIDKIKQSLKGNNRALGNKLSNETRKRMSEARKGSKNHNFGKSLSEKQRKQISIAQTGRKHSEEQRLKQIERQTGRTHSPETKAKIGAKHKGKVVSQEQKDKQSLAMKGRMVSSETRLALSVAGKGKTRSEETKRNMSEAAKLRWAKRKAQKELSNVF